MKPQAQAHSQGPVPNPNQVAPEEIGALRVTQEAPQEAPKEDPTWQNYKDAEKSEPQADQPKVAPPEEPLSSHYAALARRERALRQRERELKAAQAKLQPKEPEKPTFDPSHYVDKDRLTKDPFKVLSELGLTYDQLTEMALNAPKPEQLAMMNEISALKAEIQALKGETESTKKSFEENQKAQREQALRQIKRDVVDLVRSGEEYELIKKTGSYNEVVELIEKTFDRDGYTLSAEQAAQEVEDYLVEQAEQLARSKKIQQRLAPKQQEAQVPKSPAEPKQNNTPLKTLTNAVSTSRQMSARERALLAFEGKLQR